MCKEIILFLIYFVIYPLADKGKNADVLQKTSTFDFIPTLLTSLPKHALLKAKASINSPTIIMIVNTTANSKLFGFSRVFLSSVCLHKVEWMEVYRAPGCMGSPVLKM